METQIYFTRSTWWGAGVWVAYADGRDLGRVARCHNFGTCCTGWHGWPDLYPGSTVSDPGRNRPTVTGARTRIHAAQLLLDKLDHPED